MDVITHAERVLVGRASMLTVLVEMIEQKFAEQHMKVRAEDLELPISGSCRVCVDVLKRSVWHGDRKQVPTLEQYLSQRAKEVEDAETVE